MLRPLPSGEAAFSLYLVGIRDSGLVPSAFRLRSSYAGPAGQTASGGCWIESRIPNPRLPR
jgi:hypothetical protein